MDGTLDARGDHRPCVAGRASHRTAPARVTWHLVGAVFLLATGCVSPFDPAVCTAVAVPAIVVEIRDARTGVPLAGLAAGVVRDGAYVDSLRPAGFLDATDVVGSMLSRQAAHERPGTYTIDIRRSGYQDWTRVGVRVRSGRCHVETQSLVAQLQAVT